MNKVIAKEYVDKNYIHKDVIKPIVERINKEADWLYEEEGCYGYCEPFYNIAKELNKILEDK